VKAQITSAGPDERERLEALFELYTYDFSEILNLDVGDDGRFPAPTLGVYWIDPRYHPFLIRVDEKLAGFALVRMGSRLTGDMAVWDLAEFFVLRKYRRRGVGESAARSLFDRFRGRWEVRVRAENDAAAAFWRRVIGRYSGGPFEDVDWDDEQWRGPVLRFDSRPP
jgi:predicted acetyltransferase